MRQAGTVELTTHKRLHFAQPRAEIWAALADVDSYPEWWPWLKSFEADSLATGEVWRCRVSPPLPYTVTFDIAFDEVIDRERVATRVSGDIVGTADVALSDTEFGSDVVVRSDLAPRSPFLRLLAATMPPVVRYGHDWILSTGAAQFERRALTFDAPDTTT